MAQLKLNFQEQVLQQLNEQERIQFVFFYRQNTKKLGIAYLWLLFFGIFGLQKFYLNKRSGWLYLLFSWTLIPSVLAVIDIFLLPFQVRKYNRKLSLELFELIKKLNPTAPNLLLLDAKMRRKRLSGFEWILAFVIILGLIFPVGFYTQMRLTAHKLELHYKTNHLDGSQNDSYLVL